MGKSVLFKRLPKILVLQRRVARVQRPRKRRLRVSRSAAVPGEQLGPGGEGKREGGGWRQPSSAGLGVSVSRLSRAWWQSRAAGQGVAAGPWPGHSEEPNTSDYTSNLSKCRYVWQLSLPLQLFQLRWWRIPFFQHGRREENVQTGIQVWRVINKSFSFPPFFVY